MSCPMLCPKPHSAPSMVARTLLRPIVSGVSACMRAGKYYNDRMLFLKHETTRTCTCSKEAADECCVDMCRGTHAGWRAMEVVKGVLTARWSGRRGCAGSPPPDLPRRCALRLGGLCTNVPIHSLSASGGCGQSGTPFRRSLSSVIGQQLILCSQI